MDDNEAVLKLVAMCIAGFCLCIFAVASCESKVKVAKYQSQVHVCPEKGGEE